MIFFSALSRMISPLARAPPRWPHHVGRAVHAGTLLHRHGVWPRARPVEGKAGSPAFEKPFPERTHLEKGWSPQIACGARTFSMATTRRQRAAHAGTPLHRQHRDLPAWYLGTGSPAWSPHTHPMRLDLWRAVRRPPRMHSAGSPIAPDGLAARFRTHLEKGWSPQVSCGSIFGAARAHLLERPPLLG